MSWIKFECSTSDKAEVWQIAMELGIDPDAVVGKLLRVWAWFDSHSTTGDAPSVTGALLDRIVGVTGFCAAVERAGWMRTEAGKVSIPNFERHNGQTAKDRALTAKRMAKHRGKSDARSVTGSVTSASPEKRREEKNNTYTHTENVASANGDELPAWAVGLLVPFGWSSTRTIAALKRWDGFCQARHDAPLVDLQSNEILRKAVSLGWDVEKFEQAIGDSIRCGWKSIHLEADFEAKKQARKEKSKRGILDISNMELT
jgi:hypothetical protein